MFILGNNQSLSKQNFMLSTGRVIFHVRIKSAAWWQVSFQTSDIIIIATPSLTCNFAALYWRDLSALQKIFDEVINQAGPKAQRIYLS